MIGRKVKLYYNNTLVAVGREKTYSVSNSQTEISDGYTDGYPRFLGKPGVRSHNIAIDGLYFDNSFRTIAKSEFLIRSLALVYPDSPTVTGDFFLTRYSEGMPYNDAVTFSMSLTSTWMLPDEEYLTSKLYPVQCIEDGAHTDSAAVSGRVLSVFTESGEHSGGSVVSGTFDTTITHTYDNYEPEELEHNGGAVVSGTFDTTITHTYDNYGAEELEHNGGSVVGGVLRIQLISYNNYPIEELQHSGGSVVGGIHES